MVKIDAFMSNPASAGDFFLAQLLKEIEAEFGEKVQITISGEQDELFKEYNLAMTPAVVVGEMIKIIGVCPSKETLVSALRDAGLE